MCIVHPDFPVDYISDQESASLNALKSESFFISSSGQDDSSSGDIADIALDIPVTCETNIEEEAKHTLRTMLQFWS